MSGVSGTMRTTRLSEENLRIHNAACATERNSYQIGLIQQERALLCERETFARGVEADIEEKRRDVNSDSATMREPLQRQRPSDALKLYTGAVPSSESPMGRFVAMSPTSDTHSWMAKQAMEESGVGYGEMEALDLRTLMSELVNDQTDISMGDTAEATAGSACPSSDTLSMRRLKEWRKARKGPRVRRHIGMRRSRKREDEAAASAGQARSPEIGERMDVSYGD